MDISGHAPIPLARKIVFHLGSFSAVFRVPNFRGCFEALNDIFWGFGALVTVVGTYLDQSKTVILGYTFTMSYHAPKIEIICKSYELEKLMY